MLCHLLSALSLFLCHNVEMLFHLFLEKNGNFPEVHFKGYHCSS